MRQLTFPRDTTWQKSTCLTPSLTSSTTTSTMQQVREAEQRCCWFARWLFWMKEGSQALSPYYEVLNGFTFSPTYSEMGISAQLPALHPHLVVLLRLTMANTDVIMTYYREPWGRITAARPSYLLELHCRSFLRWSIPGPWFDTKSRTWPVSITRHGDSHLYSPRLPRQTLSFKNTL